MTAAGGSAPAQPRPHVVVVGDVLLDMDVDGRVERLCPDAPVPVLDVERTRTSPGGAGLAALLCGARCRVTLVAPVADDEHGEQLAAQLGAFEAQAPGERRVGGAQLVNLSKPDGATPYPKVFTQASLNEADPRPESGSSNTFPAVAETKAIAGETGDEVRPTWMHELIGQVVGTLRAGAFPAQLGPGCKYCAFTSSCPAQRAGQQVVS